MGNRRLQLAFRESSAVLCFQSGLRILSNQGYWTGSFLVLNGRFTLRVTEVYEKYKLVLRSEPLLTVTGEVQRDGVVNLIAHHMAGL
jgi:hypothetical protein